MLWRVSDENSHVYLLGSVDVLRQSDYPLREIYDVAFDQVDGLVVEADLSEDAIISTYLTLNSGYDSGNLSQDFPFSTRQKLRGWFRDNGFQYTLEYRPWYLATMITQVEVFGQSAFTAEGVDAYFIEEANQRDLPIEFLESWQVGLDYLISMPPEVAEQTILVLIDSPDDAIEQLNQLIDDWNAGDLAAMQYYISEEYNSSPQNPLSISGRNLAWMPKIEGYLAHNQKFMIVAGVGHMVGNYGLLQLLANEGYQVERLPEEPWAELNSPEVFAGQELLRTQISGAMGHLCVIETTSDLSDPDSWSMIDSITLTDEPTTIEAPYAASDERLFLRGRMVE